MFYNVFYPRQINITMSISLTVRFNLSKAPDRYAKDYMRMEVYPSRL